MTKKEFDPLLSLRAACILLLALVVGLLAAALSYWSGQPIAGAVLVGGSAFAGSIVLLHQLVGR